MIGAVSLDGIFVLLYKQKSFYLGAILGFEYSQPLFIFLISMKRACLVICLLPVFLLFSDCGNVNEVTIPYEEENERIYLPVTVNGKTYRFVFDTGTCSSILNYQVAQHDGIYPDSKMKTTIHTVRETFVDTTYCADREFYIGSLEFKRSAFRLANYNRSFEMGDLLGENEGGILGVKEIRTKNWLFDLKAKTVTVSDNEIGVEWIGCPQDLCMVVNPDSTETYVDVLLNDSLRRTFLFDTGWSSGTKANFKDREYYWQTGFSVSNSVFQKLKSLRPINGHLQFVSEVKINNLRLDTVSVSLLEKEISLFSINPKVIGKDSCIIGTSFLKNFDYMLIDSHNQQIRFYGYHAANQGERDFMKSLARKEE